MSLVTIRTFDNAVAAHMLKSKLENEGIPCYLFDENIVSLNPLYNVTVGGIKLKINELDRERAQQVIHAIEEAPLLKDNNELLSCPSCDATDLIAGYKSMKGLKGILSAAVSFLLLVFPIYYKTVYKCKQCGTEFKQ